MTVHCVFVTMGGHFLLRAFAKALVTNFVLIYWGIVS